MRRLSTTVLAVVGPEAETCLGWLDQAANVSTVVVPPIGGDDGPSDAVDRARRAWQRVVRSKARYTMHTADPLQAVGEAWIAAFDGHERGRLELSVSEVLSRLRTDAVGLPDYYLVLDPDSLPEAGKHWYLGVLHRAAPHRVVPVEPDGPSVATAVGRLPAGRWWPDPADLLADLASELPDQPMTVG